MGFLYDFAPSGATLTSPTLQRGGGARPQPESRRDGANRPALEPPAPSARILNQTMTAIGPKPEPNAVFVARGSMMIKFLLFCILFVLCWPLALLALIAYPFVWLLLLPFRIVGIAVGGALELVSAIIFLPARVIRAI
jgi:hypothetical protein